MSNLSILDHLYNESIIGLVYVVSMAIGLLHDLELGGLSVCFTKITMH